jgi:hypothetical protein
VRRRPPLPASHAPKCCHRSSGEDGKAEPTSSSRRSDDMAGYPRYQGDGLAGALAIHLCIYCFVGGCFAFGLYELLQPTRSINPGLAAYKPPPATVISYGTSSSQAAPSYPVPMEPVAAAALLTPEPETTGRSMPLPEQARDTPSRPRREVKTKTGRREVKSEPSRGTARVACIARYDSSGAQTGSC